jgi:hypothetical protein
MPWRKIPANERVTCRLRSARPAVLGSENLSPVTAAMAPKGREVNDGEKKRRRDWKSQPTRQTNELLISCRIYRCYEDPSSSPAEADRNRFVGVGVGVLRWSKAWTGSAYGHRRGKGRTKAVACQQYPAFFAVACTAAAAPPPDGSQRRGQPAETQCGR